MTEARHINAALKDKKSMTGAATLSAKYQIAVPKSVRERMGWRPVQRTAFIARTDGVLMVPVPKRKDLAGIARGANPSGTKATTNDPA